jgi:alanine racemase
MTEQTYRCWAEIDEDALRRNATAVRERIGTAELLAVVKANGYGHGMVGVAKALAKEAQLFGVANLEEALTLRSALPHPVMILGPALPQERSTIVERGFIATISTLEEAEDFDRLAQHGKAVVNFKVDTGMGRMGVPEKEALPLFRKVAALPNVTIHSVSTHMPVSNEDADYTRHELVRFATIVKEFRAEIPGDYKAHVLQSAGTLAFANPTFDIVRAGIMLYGISPLPEFQGVLQPALTWKARVGLVRDLPAGSSISYGRTFITSKPTRIATITAGYADGYPRHLSDRDAVFLIRGQRCPVLGRVTMDLMMADVSNVKEVRSGDEVILMGRSGNEEISANELADRAGTIPWEVITRIGARVRRLYV